MKKSSYMTRALKARDPRYARILGKLGYERADMVAAGPIEPVKDELAVLRDEYLKVIGKRPFHGWDAEKLRAKIDEAKA